MARFSKQDGGWRLWLTHVSKRASIYFKGNLSKNKQTSILALVEELERVYRLGVPLSDSMERRLDDIEGTWLEEKLEAQGLLQRKRILPLNVFLNQLIAKRTDLAISTLQKWGNVRRSLIGYFGEDKRITEITAGDAEDFKLFLENQGLAEATISKRIRLARQFFGNAVKHEQIKANPFIDVRGGSERNEDRWHYVSIEDINQILEYAPDATWRALIVLWRFGGLRKDEALHLRWSDVLWDQQRLRIPSPKTARYGKSERIIPLWPKLEKVISDLYHEANEGDERIIARYKPGQNVATEFSRIVQRSGIEKWPRLIQNLRSSCQNDLESSGVRISVTANWIGNSETVARKHYLGVTDEDFDNALAAQPFSKIVQNPVQNQAAGGRMLSAEENQEPKKDCKTGGVPLSAILCNPLQNSQVPPLGLEPRTL
jgi:integrase